MNGVDVTAARLDDANANPHRSEPYELAWHNIAKVLKDEAWEGRWCPLDETNIAPLAGITAEAIIEGFARHGLRLVAVDVDPDTTEETR